MLITLPQSLLGRLDIAGATKDEVAQPIDLLPSRLVERAVAGREEEFAQLVEAKAARPIDIQPAETVWAPKPAHIARYRPIAALRKRR